MAINGTLKTHLADINEQAIERYECLMEQFKHEKGITEKLKALDSLKWLQLMNYISYQADEVILNELIYV